MTAARLAPALALAQGFLTGCACWSQPAPQVETLVVVVPSRHDGHVGAVVVNEGDKREVLNTAYASARTVANSQDVARGTMSADEVNRTFAAASEALPHKAVTYTLYFQLAKLELAPESNAVLDAMLSEVASRQAAVIVVAGHTDRIGTDARNDELSLRRAKAVRELVINRGVAAGIVSAVGMGEREPIVPTEDGVAEPKNRRVEILIR